MENDLIEIFIGSEIETNYISSILSENNIDHIVENRFNQSLAAGWVSGSAYNSCIVKVNIEDSDKAKQLIKDRDASCMRPGFLPYGSLKDIRNILLQPKRKGRELHFQVPIE